eukprot:TRINITY_DN61028_c0_g1_i1.p1 TRINITY_DN61028_c0_g1~~TRINITY_DN61028_c0_g1_i1.p1  ORF type:complete len:414 (-),score=55.69 TRINITY_DN61028_c0_g1_i1:90-1331(-)
MCNLRFVFPLLLCVSRHTRVGNCILSSSHNDVHETNNSYKDDVETNNSTMPASALSLLAANVSRGATLDRVADVAEVAETAPRSTNPAQKQAVLINNYGTVTAEAAVVNHTSLTLADAVAAMKFRVAMATDLLRKLAGAATFLHSNAVIGPLAPLIGDNANATVRSFMNTPEHECTWLRYQLLSTLAGLFSVPQLSNAAQGILEESSSMKAYSLAQTITDEGAQQQTQVQVDFSPNAWASFFSSSLMWGLPTCLVAFLCFHTKTYPPEIFDPSAQPMKDGEWAFGLFSCFDDMPLSLFTLCCSTISWAETMHLARLMDFWLAFFVVLTLTIIRSAPIGNIAPITQVALVVLCVVMRQRIRAMFYIRNGELDILAQDFCAYCCCFCCSIVQEARQLKEAYRTRHESVAYAYFDR